MSSITWAEGEEVMELIRDGFMRLMKLEKLDDIGGLNEWME